LRFFARAAAVASLLLCAACGKPGDGGSVLPQLGFSRWQVSDTTSQLDGSRTYVADLPSSDIVLNILGRPDHAQLLVMCNGPAANVGVVWPGYLGSNNLEVRWKADQGAVVDDIWYVTPDGHIAYAGGPQRAWPMLEALARSQRLVVDLAPYQSGPQEATFDLVGLGDIVTKLRTICPLKAGA
jgi:hypothetical protein